MRRYHLFVPMMFAVGGVLVAGCDSDSDGTGGTVDATVDVAKSALERDQAPEVTASELDELVAGNTAFAFDMYEQLAGEPGNLVFSPHSISVALAMTYAGAEGSTEAELATALSFTLPEPTLHEAFNALDLALSSRGEGAAGQDGEPFRLRVVNAAWAQRDYAFTPSYLDVLGLNYGAGVKLLDFVADTELSRETINAWVSKQTEARIPELLPPGGVTAMTRLVLTNAVYFNASWLYQFEPEMTSDADFTRLDGSTVQVPTMVQTASLGVAQVDGFTALELPYDGQEVSMLLLTTDGDFDTLEASLDETLLADVDAALAYGQVEVHLPKFEYRAKARLVPALRALGVSDAFSPGAADLSGMNGGRDLVISDIFHEAFILLDETGTEAAAATAVVAGATSMPPPPTAVHFDRPFIYLIRDVDTGAVIFVGRVVDPSA